MAQAPAEPGHPHASRERRGHRPSLRDRSSKAAPGNRRRRSRGHHPTSHQMYCSARRVGQRRDRSATGLAAELVCCPLEAPQGCRVRHLVRSDNFLPPNANISLYLLLLNAGCYYRPWNYPIILSFQPVMGAMAAGCPAVLKPSEISPATSSLLADLFPKYLDHSAYRVINGGVPEVTYLLKLKWDHSAYDRAIPGVDRMLIVCAQSRTREMES